MQSVVTGQAPISLQCTSTAVVYLVIVLWAQSLYLSRVKNQRGHGLCWMSTAAKNVFDVKNTHHTSFFYARVCKLLLPLGIRLGYFLAETVLRVLLVRTYTNWFQWETKHVGFEILHRGFWELGNKVQNLAWPFKAMWKKLGAFFFRSSGVIWLCFGIFRQLRP